MADADPGVRRARRTPTATAATSSSSAGSTACRCASSSTATSARRWTWRARRWPSWWRCAGSRRLAPTVGRYFGDERLQKVFSFQAMYAGVSPQQALAIYAVISYMDLVEGVFYPVGGMNALPTAMAAAAGAAGVDICYDTEVSEVRWQGKRVREVIAADGRSWSPDALVLTLDMPAARELLGRPSRRPGADPLLPQLRGPVGRAAERPTPTRRTTRWSSAARGRRCSRTSSRAGSCATRRSSCRCPRRPTRAWPPRGAARRTSCSPPPT